MILYVHSNVLYLSEPQVQSHHGSQHFLGNKTDTRINRPILALAKILPHVILLATEDKLTRVFHDTKEATPIFSTITKLEHQQLPMPIQTNNTTTVGTIDKKNTRDSKQWIYATTGCRIMKRSNNSIFAGAQDHETRATTIQSIIPQKSILKKLIIPNHNNG